jgi:hypothetical protein
VEAPLLSDEQLAWLGRPLSIVVAARDPSHAPCLTRAIGWGFDRASGRMHLMLDRRFGLPVLDALECGSGLAVVFSEPASHRTLQIKGDAARVIGAAPQALAAAAAYAAAFGSGLAALGYDATLAAGLFDVERAEPMCVEFTPRAVFEQTPGPRAGRMLAEAPR